MTIEAFLIGALVALAVVLLLHEQLRLWRRAMDRRVALARLSERYVGTKGGRA